MESWYTPQYTAEETFSTCVDGVNELPKSRRARAGVVNVDGDDVDTRKPKACDWL